MQKDGEVIALLQVASCTFVCFRVSSGNAESLDFALRETSSGLSNHAAVVGLRVVITLKHSKYNVQDARLFIGHNPAYIAKQPCELCILFHFNY